MGRDEGAARCGGVARTGPHVRAARVHVESVGRALVSCFLPPPLVGDRNDPNQSVAWWGLGPDRPLRLRRRARSEERRHASSWQEAQPCGTNGRGRGGEEGESFGPNPKSPSIPSVCTCSPLLHRYLCLSFPNYPALTKTEKVPTTLVGGLGCLFFSFFKNMHTYSYIHLSTYTKHSARV